MNRVHCTTSWRRQWQPTPVLLLGKSHGRRSLVGCSPWGCEKSDTTEWLPFHFPLSCIGEGNGNPLQCSCLENPRDRGAWWAAVYGVAQSWTWLKWVSSSSTTSSLILSLLYSCLRCNVWKQYLEAMRGNHSKAQWILLKIYIYTYFFPLWLVRLYCICTIYKILNFSYESMMDDFLHFSQTGSNWKRTVMVTIQFTQKN